MQNWYMLTLVGKDQPGIVARVSLALYQADCNLGEASMLRLGGNFTVMLMVLYSGSLQALDAVLKPVADALDVHMHLDEIEGHLHEHWLPDVRVSVVGSDQPGIVAKVTSALAQAGLNILNLESDVGGRVEQPLYIMHIEGQARAGIESLRAALERIKQDGIETSLVHVETLVG